MNTMGLGGPGLTNATFTHGVNQIVANATQNANNRLDFEQNRNTRSFTNKHGDALATRVHRLCNVA